MMATSTDDLLPIYHRYPFLAFLLALCNPSTILSGVSSISRPDSQHQPQQMLQSKRSRGYNQKIDQYLSLIHDMILHFAAGSIAGIMVWQSTLLGMRRVIVFACWTWHEPFTWVGVGGLIQLSTIAWRLCLGPTVPSQKWSRWHWSLSRSGGNLTLAHPHWARFSDILFQVIELMNYGFGTVMLSGTSLVSPVNGLTVFCLMGFSSMSSRLLAIWLLEVFPEVSEVSEVAERGIMMDALKRSGGESLVELLRAEGEFRLLSWSILLLGVNFCMIEIKLTHRQKKMNLTISTELKFTVILLSSDHSRWANVSDPNFPAISGFSRSAG
jgi:hypothetical protein